MTETSRVQRWREGKRQQGLKAVTIWLTQEEELRLKDLALQWHCSPSALVQQALAQFAPQTAPGISTATDTSQIRELIRAELDARQAELDPVTDTVTETVTATVTEAVTETVTATLERDLPAMVRAIVEALVLEAFDAPVTDMFSDVTETDDDSADTFGNVTDTEAPALPVTDTDYGNATDIDAVEEAPAPRQTRRPRGEMRQRILTLLGEHHEGLSAEEIRVYLKAEKPLGDTLQGMRKQQKVHTRGTGKAMRYFVA
jgi:predicted transcriptional regulator